MMHAAIHNLDNDTHYVVYDASECRDATDRSAYQEACRLQDVVTMGKVIVEPLKGETD